MANDRVQARSDAGDTVSGRRRHKFPPEHTIVELALLLRRQTRCTRRSGRLVRSRGWCCACSGGRCGRFAAIIIVDVRFGWRYKQRDAAADVIVVPAADIER